MRPVDSRGRAATTHEDHIDRVAVWLIRIFEGSKTAGRTDAECLDLFGEPGRRLATVLLDDVATVVGPELDRINENRRSA